MKLLTVVKGITALGCQFHTFSSRNTSVAYLAGEDMSVCQLLFENVG